VKKEKKFVETPIENIHIGDIVAVKAGVRISIDGIIKNGHSSVNQAPITGESLPISKDVGDVVYAGTINQNGYLEIEVTKESHDTTLAKIIELVERAEAKKAPTERFIDKFAKYFTPSVILLAVLITVIPTYIFGQPFGIWFYKSLLLLLISCPCALALSTPISIVSGITSGARNGVLFKGGVYVEKLAKIDTIAFDKTGTLTEGKPVVTDVISFNDYSRKDILTIASSLECRSDHPLGKAIIEEAEKEGDYKECSDFTSIPGQGIKGKVENEQYFVGRKSLFEKRLLIDLSETFNKFEDEGKTIVIVGKSDQIFGIIGITDKIRNETVNLVKSLHEKGIKQVVMLTGDNKRTAKAVAEKIGIDEYYSELLPEEKVLIIEKIKKNKQKVAMIGDGVNDAPSLATADLGIAMGVAGSDTALEVADIALMNDDLSRVSYLLSLGKKTMSVIKQNIFGAIGVKLILAILVFPGLVTLWMAVAIGDMGISLAVILNALRLSKLKT
jgi:Cd2+/Zn2+-exporting ATPase